MLKMLQLGVALAAMTLATPAAAADPAETAQSTGVPGGIVVLWPKLTPNVTYPSVLAQAREAQSLIAAGLAKAMPDRKIDVRPRPQRLCPEDGCVAVSVAISFVHRETGCAVIATVGDPGPSNKRVVPLTGKVAVRAGSIPFLQPAESVFKLMDFARCTDLEADLEVSQSNLHMAVADALVATASTRPVPVATPKPSTTGSKSGGEDVGWP